MRDASFRYAGSDEFAVSGFDLRVRGGECVALCGKSGCGKSTVLRMVNGMIPNFHDGQRGGFVSVAGRDPFECAMWELAGVVGTVFQNPRTQFYTTDVTAEVAFGCENAGLPRREIARRVDDACELMGISHLRGRSIFGLSGGEKQAVAFASVVAMDPDVIVLDEPSSNLDLSAMARLGKAVELLKARGKAILIAEHRLEWVADALDRVVLMEEGRAARAMSVAQVAAMGWEERLTSGVRPIGAPRMRPACGGGAADAPCANEAVAGASRAHAVADVATSEGGGDLWGHGLRYRYRCAQSCAVDVDRFALPARRVTALVGRNGAGKSTFSRCLAGLARLSEGHVYRGEEPLDARGRLTSSFVVMQDVNRQLFCKNVREEIALSLDGADGLDVEGLCAELDLAGLEARHPMSLSGGQKQRVAVACALASGKRLLIFDEPTSGLDYAHMVGVARLLRGVADRGASVLVVTHDLDLVAECCDEALVLEGGAAVAQRPVDDGMLAWLGAYLRDA